MRLLNFGDKIKIGNIVDSYERLENKLYQLTYNDQDGFYLVPKEMFELPSKLYGNHDITKRWVLSSENNTEKNMGIILSGLKGSGKTITAQKFCIDSGRPIILINSAFTGTDFVNFITSPLLEKSIIFVDEFEKVYSNRRDEDYKDLLAIMDGNYKTNLIFLLTVNNFEINEFLVNRLNRIKYRKHYETLELDIIEDVISDLLINKNYKEDLITVLDKINIVTFDLLINIIKECNLFNETPSEVVKHLNLKVESRYYDVKGEIDGKTFKCDSLYTNFEEPFYLTKTSGGDSIKIKNEDGEDETFYEYYISDDNIKTIVKKHGYIVLTTNNDYIFKFSPKSKMSLVF